MSNSYERFWSSCWLALAGPVVLAGLVLWSWPAVVAMLMVALAFSFVIFGSIPTGAPLPHPAYGGLPWRQSAAPAVRWAVLAVALIVTAVSFPWVALLLVVALVGTSPWFLGRLKRDAPPVADELSPERIRYLLRQLNLASLCGAWRESHRLLAEVHDVATRSKVVMLRQEYLDEMERRDARGFQEWLSVARDATDPEIFLTERGDGAAAA